MWLQCLFVVLIIGSASAQRDRNRQYDGQKVFRITPNTLEDVEKVLDLAKTYDLDIWDAPKMLNHTFDILVKPEIEAKFIKTIENMGMEASVWIKNLQKAIAIVANKTGFTIHSYLDSLAGHPHVQVLSMGHSYEGRDLKYVKISTGGTKKAIYIDGGIHAREWISISTVLYIIDQLANNPNGDSAVATLLNKFDFYLLPVVNPDGFEYSIDHDRMWRKNRKPVAGSRCLGTDLNRNFNYAWSPDNGGSRNPCESVFAGVQAGSEPEVKSVSNFLDSHSNIIAYLNVHTYGQLWIYPWGYTSRLPSDWHDLDHLGRVAANAIYKTHHTRYTVGEDTRVLYAAAGGADDYAKGHASVKYAYTVELRDTGSHGFVMPASYIIPTGEETWNGVKAFASELISYEHL